MKFFISYKFAGEDTKELEVILTKISNVLKEKGWDSYSAFSDENLFTKRNFTLKQILHHALKELDNSDYLLVFIRSPERTEGMLMEIGYALAKKKKILLAIKEGIRMPFVEDIADKKIEFNNEEDFLYKLRKLDI